MNECLLSIDNGLTAVKAVLFALDGREIHAVSAPTPLQTGHGLSEVDLAGLWQLTAGLIRSVIRTAGIDPAAIIGVGNSGHGGGLYLVDSRRQPVRPAITSMDARALPLLAAWRAEGIGSGDILHQELWGGQAIPLLAWLRQYEPESLQRTAWILSAKDWIIECLTGQPGLEASDASNSGLINPRTRQVAADLLAHFGLADCTGKIPPIRSSTGLAGRITPEAARATGLAAGTPVAGGAFDCAACALGSGIIRRNGYSLIAGTWNINGSIDPFLHPMAGATKCSLFPDGRHYFYVESSATSAVNLEWFIRGVLRQTNADASDDRQLYTRINALVAAVRPEENDLVYLPFLYPAGLVNHLPGAGWLNLRPEHTLQHLLAAVYEGVAFAHRLHLERLRTAGISRAAAVLTGGASNSEVWCRIFANILDLPVETVESAQTGALGAAMCAAVATGRCADLDSATRQMVRQRAEYQPEPAMRPVYERKYQVFQRIIRQLDQPIYEQEVIV